MTNNNDRIEEAANLFDNGHQALHVGVRRIPLIRRRLDAIDRQRDQQHECGAQRIAIRPNDGSAISDNLSCQLVLGDSGADFLRRQSHRTSRGLLTPCGLALCHLCLRATRLFRTPKASGYLELELNVFGYQRDRLAPQILHNAHINPLIPRVCCIETQLQIVHRHDRLAIVHRQCTCNATPL